MTTANALAKHYGSLTPEERFRLIVAAGARGDKANQDQLKAAGQPLHLSVSDHTPFAEAFNELNMLIYIDLLDTLAWYWEAFRRADDAEFLNAEEDNAGDADEAEPENEDAGDADAEMDTRPRPPWQRSLDSLLASGYMLKTKADGWKLFCERLSIPPFCAWEVLPGFKRLHRTLNLAEEAAFTAEGMVAHLNQIRPEGAPKVTELTLTPETCAAGLDILFRQIVESRGGPSADH